MSRLEKLRDPQQALREDKSPPSATLVEQSMLGEKNREGDGLKAIRYFNWAEDNERGRRRDGCDRRPRCTRVGPNMDQCRNRAQAESRRCPMHDPE